MLQLYWKSGLVGYVENSNTVMSSPLFVVDYVITAAASSDGDGG